MSVYGAIVTGAGATALTVGVKAGIYPLKIIRIDVVGNTFSVTEYASASLSAGSSITPYPFRFGAPAASATARSGAPTGTSTTIYSMAGAVNTTYTPPTSLIIPPGAAISAVLSSGATLVSVVFDELEIQPGY